MSVSGNLAMAALRLVKPGKGSYTDLEKCKAKAAKENARFVFSVPKSGKADFSLPEGTDKPCLVIHPKQISQADKAILYIYGGITNNWLADKAARWKKAQKAA